jgi:GNAT superfamily N-acetyltransferase
MDGMDIAELSADDAPAVAGVTEVMNAVAAADSPWEHPRTVAQTRGSLLYGWDLEPARHFVGLLDGRFVALGLVETSEWDNHDLAWLDVLVHPDVRCRGIGNQMYDHVLEVAKSMGRTKFGADAWDGGPGTAFAVARGFEARSRAIKRRQHLAEVPLDKIEAMYAAASAAASDYELIRLAGRTPDELMPAVAEMSAAINDAPLDDLEIEDEVFPPERVRNYETATESRGQRMYRLLARHRDTGTLAGHTVVAVETERPEIGHQHDTTVVREHRGHRLGLALKTGLNLWLAEVEPQLQTIDTWNAESNDHMIGVNEELGYRWMGRGVQFQK